MKTALSIILTAALALAAAAQDDDYPSLPHSLYRSGQRVLDAFAPVSARTRDSIVELDVDEDTVALGTVVDTNGLVLTKASELRAGKLTCWLPNGDEVPAQLLASDDSEDVALVRVKAAGLKPIRWATNQLTEGQWAITPGLADTPQAVGIISTLTHRVRPQRAFIGVTWNRQTSVPIVSSVQPGFGAEKAGVMAGDVILAVDGTAVTNWQEVAEILQGFRDGQTVHIRFQREKKEFDAAIKLKAPGPGQLGINAFESERESRFSGDVSLRSQGFEQAIQHDTVLEPWQCGGPLVNLNGEAIGLNIARANRVATYALPADLARKVLARLKADADKP